MIQINVYIILMENIIMLYLNWRVFFFFFFYKLSSKIASNFTKQKLWYDVKLFGCMFKCTNIFIYVCNIIDTCRCTCIFVLNLVYMKYMQQRSSPVRMYVNMKYCRVLDSQKQWLFLLAYWTCWTLADIFWNVWPLSVLGHVTTGMT